MAVGFLVALEYLFQISEAHGAVVFVGKNVTLINYALDYGPLAIAAVYGLVWASVDHDIKRLGPYFQPSNPEGVMAEHLLLLGTHTSLLPLHQLLRCGRSQ